MFKILRSTILLVMVFKFLIVLMLPIFLVVLKIYKIIYKIITLY